MLIQPPNYITGSIIYIYICLCVCVCELLPLLYLFSKDNPCAYQDNEAKPTNHMKNFTIVFRITRILTSNKYAVYIANLLLSFVRITVVDFYNHNLTVLMLLTAARFVDTLQNRILNYDLIHNIIV